MEREKAKFDVLQRILDERDRKGWNEYTLAQKSGLTQSTISTWYRKKLQPSVASIEKICNGLGITLSDFFMEYKTGDNIELSKKQAELLMLWSKLTEKQSQSILDMINSLIE